MPAEQLDLSAPQRIHIVGVGGAGMSSLALVLAGMGHRISGSDLRGSSVTDRLGRAGIEVTIGHAAATVDGAGLVTASPAVPATNVELAAAAAAGIAVIRRPELMGALTRRRPTAAVAGTHGKTTTSSMLSLVLLEAGLEPSYLLGADLAGLGAGAHWGSGDILVMEADESYGAFADLEPELTAITNVEADHLDHYGTLEQLEEAFAGLLERSRGPRVVWGEDPGARRVGADLQALVVGMSSEDDLVVGEVELGRAASRFVLTDARGDRIPVRVGAPGAHNVANAAVAASAGLLLGASGADVERGLSRFAGVPRRFEFRGEVEGVQLVDDYAHLPTEVRAALSAAKAGGYRRIVAVFQPHRYTRTQAVAGDFEGAFDQADIVVVTDVYAAGEEPIPGVSGALVAEAAGRGPGAPAVHYVPDRSAVAEVVSALLAPGDLCLSLGAGDLTELPDELRARSS